MYNSVPAKRGLTDSSDPPGMRVYPDIGYASEKPAASAQVSRVVTSTGCVTPSPFSANVDTKGASGNGEQEETHVSVLATLVGPPVLRVGNTSGGDDSGEHKSTTPLNASAATERRVSSDTHAH
jgi:hypothetical protein